jgi:hypothetical protein
MDISHGFVNSVAILEAHFLKKKKITGAHFSAKSGWYMGQIQVYMRKFMISL